MARKLREAVLGYLRRLCGTEQLRQRQLALHDELLYALARQHQVTLLAMGNALQASLADPEEVRQSAAYKRCAAVVSLLSPLGVSQGAYVRVGRDYDGGYVMLDTFRRPDAVEAAYSFGVGEDASWDEAIANCGIPVYLYDHTVERAPTHHPACRFSRVGLTGRKQGPGLKTLEELLKENGHANCTKLLLKMDIEWCEWDVFSATPSSVLQQFSQMVVEMHGLTPHDDGAEYQTLVATLRKLNQTHQVVHVHANGIGLPIWIGGLVLPPSLEVTYLRRADFSFVPNVRRFPTALDQPTCPWLPDLYLGRFAVEGAGEARPQE